MPFSRPDRAISVLSEDVPHSWDTGPDRIAVPFDAGLVRHAAGNHTAASRTAHRRRAIGPLEANALGGEAIHRRSGKMRIAREAHRAPRLLIGKDEQNVGLTLPSKGMPREHTDGRRATDFKKISTIKHNQIPDSKLKGSFHRR